MANTKIKVKTLVLNAGYVEDESVCSCVISHIHGFKSVDEALKHLARQFIKEPEGVDECCSTTLKVLPKASFCSQCSRKLLQRDCETDVYEGVDGFLQSDMCGIDNEVWEKLDDTGWTLMWSKVDKSKSYLVSRAPEVLSKVAIGAEYQSAMVQKG